MRWHRQSSPYLLPQAITHTSRPLPSPRLQQRRVPAPGVSCSHLQQRQRLYPAPTAQQTGGPHEAWLTLPVWSVRLFLFALLLLIAPDCTPEKIQSTPLATMWL